MKTFFDAVLWCTTGDTTMIQSHQRPPKKPIVEETRYYTKLNISVPRHEVKYDSRHSRLYKRQATRKLMGLQLCSYLFTKKILKFFFLTFSRQDIFTGNYLSKILKTVSTSIEKQSLLFRCSNGANSQESVESSLTPLAGVERKLNQYHFLFSFSLQGLFADQRGVMSPD